MTLLEIWFLALALSVDAFVVAFSYGLIIKKKKGVSALKIASATGLGQFIMPVLGWYGARTIYHQIEQIDQWIAFFVFLMLGLKVISDSLREDECPEKLTKTLSFKVLLMIGVATSIDAFVSGSMLYFVKANAWGSAALIGVTTFICSIIGFNFCRMFKKFPTQWLEIGSGVILISLGAKILYEHLSA